jgi:hypothetical protein
MLYDGMKILEGSEIVNATVGSGTSFPNSPATGQMFFRSDSSKMFIYNGTQWSEIPIASSSAGSVPRVLSIVVTDSSYVATGASTLSTSGGYVKITGAGFVAGCSVFFGSTSAVAVTVTSAQELRVQAPARPAGKYIVYVANTDGTTGLYVQGVTYA